MGSENNPVRNSGIYHSLPQFDPSIKDLTAIITGANGISGFHTMRALLDSPQRWSKIYAVSRRPPPPEMMQLLTADQRSRVEHVASDFLKSPEDIAESLSHVKNVDYIFFYSYLQPPVDPDQPAWSNADELVKVNSALLRNFLSALTITNLKPKRFLLQTGAKQYGAHIGRTRMPIESDPRSDHLEPNFYYPQEDMLFDYSRQNGVPWNVIRPAWIIGAVNNAQMNALHPFAVYAAVAAQKGEPLVFPGSWESWNGIVTHSTARLTGYLSEWAVLEEKCQNQAFNSQDTSPITYDRFFEELARWFGVEKGVKPPPDDESKMFEIKGKPGKDTPMGYGPPKITRAQFTFTSWASDQSNAEAWSAIQKSQPSLTHNPFSDVQAHFTFGDGALMFVGTSLSMNKARRLGWTGFVDTFESTFEMYREMEKLGMVPRMKVEEARPLV